jgi:hypothetical protein
MSKSLKGTAKKNHSSHTHTYTEIRTCGERGTENRPVPSGMSQAENTEDGLKKTQTKAEKG